MAPLVTPVITSRPPALRDSRFSSQTDAPTQSNTRSTPCPSVSSSTLLLKFGVFVVVDDLVGSQFQCAVELPLAAGSGDDAGAHHLCDLDSHAADSAACGLYQNVIPWANLRLGDEAVPCSVGGDGQGRRFGEVHVVGDDVGVDGRGGDVLGMAAVQVYPQPFLVGALVVAPHLAVVAVGAGDPVVENHSVSDFQLCIGRRADGRHLAGDVAAQDAGERPAIGASFAQVEVQVVEGAGPHAEHNLAGADLRFGPVAADELVGSAVLVNEDCFHLPSSSLFLRPAFPVKAGIQGLQQIQAFAT